MSAKYTKARSGESFFETRAKLAFDASVAGLDGEIRRRLAAARAAALERPGRAASVPFFSRGWIPAGAVAAAVFAAWMIWQQETIREPGTETAVLGDLEILTGGEEFDMLEDLEFYSWLDEQPEMESADGVDDTRG